MLYIVSTPIGNLNDLSYRQATTLINSDIVLAEDTRTYQKLLTGIKKIFNLSPKNNQKLISYYRENEFQKLSEVLDLLRNDKTISLVSEAGTPLISDPGLMLMKEVIKQNIPYDVIPGPSAVISAIVLSGFSSQKWMFLGYLPKRKIEIIKLFRSSQKGVIYIAFESPKRINKTLKILSGVSPDAEIAICREMTKKFQEVVRGKPKELYERTYKGEITIVFKF